MYGRSWATFKDRIQVISRVPSIDVSIHTGGHVAQEYPPLGHYDDDVHGCPSHISYIESKSGEKFSIEVSVTPGNEAFGQNVLVCAVYVDGNYVQGLALTGENHDPSRGIRKSIIGPLGPSSTLERATQHSFTFTPVSLVEEVSNAAIEEQARISQNLGTIRVQLLRGRKWQCVAPHTITRVSPTFVLTEKALKGKDISHGTSFPPSHIVPYRQGRCSFDPKPIARYEFRYRSRGALQRELIIPFTPPPPTRSASEEIASMTEEEVRRALLRTKRQQAVKLEDISLHAKRTIDLTDDDVDVSGNGPFKMIKMEDSRDVVDLT
ncbi:hypothetical protein QQS21_008933 [Conoideocrella luteorostrata]|uniref:DUF7918 domain-containing protein n=1 Tax=Conoideocrella luteorostrata TaxID=1105319 RepID=A0AAJ0CK91_9HYPO|nr:hypothetical protein QQS21_008933 [Conoideocrella luteorostrata]